MTPVSSRAASKNPRLSILLTNDDGYRADGITALFETLRKKHKVTLVAPDREQSASSHSLTVHRPLRMHQLDRHRAIVDGTPTDSVMLGIHVLFKKHPPDLLVSGINHGANMGDDVTYSGTIAAAIEGAILGIPSIAISMANWVPDMPMKRAASFVEKLLPAIRSWKLDPSIFLNINLPADNGKAYKEYQFTEQGFRFYQDIVIKKTDPRGRDYFWIGGSPIWKNLTGSDYAAVKKGIVSITPMKLDFTSYPTLQRLRENKPR
jgi:5'-nucleotidase